MPTWKQKLAAIKDLRNQRQKVDQELYAAKVNLQKADAELKRVRQKESWTEGGGDEIQRIRERIEQLEKQLQDMDREANAIKATIATITEVNNQVEFLTKKTEAVKTKMVSVQNGIDEEKQKENGNPQKIEELEAEFARLKELLGQLNHDLAARQAERQQLQDRQQEAENKKNELDRQRHRVHEETDRLQNDLAHRTKPVPTDPGETANNKQELEASLKRNDALLEGLRTDLHSSIAGLYEDPHPRENLLHLPDDIPFLLLPVRIETRFIHHDHSDELWVRVYPDEIAIHTHEKILTDKEVAEGEKYWKALFNAEKNGGNQKEDQKKSAWSHLAELFGPSRAAWIAGQTKPVNWAADLPGINSEDQLNFPAHDLTKTNAWNRAPRTTILPDKFVLMLYEGTNIVIERVGNIIPDELFLGPDPMDSENAFVTKNDKLVFGPSYDWTSDFTKAIEKGMGFKIGLNADQAKNGFTKLLLLGVYLSSDETESKKSIENLIDNHHYSPKGFSLVKQGTPTNNTDSNASGYTKNDSFHNTSYFVETGKELFTEIDDCDGRNLADALGIDYTPLQYILNSDSTDHKEAVAMNRALYPSTLGYYFESLMSPVLNEEQQDQLRIFFTDHVTGRGWLPSIRVGNQPYGILPTSDFSNWRWHPGRLLFGSGFLDKVLLVLNSYHQQWLGQLNRLMYVGKPGYDPDKVLVDILGLQPGSVSFYQRTGYSTEDLMNRDGFEYGDKYYDDMQKNFTSKNRLLSFLNQLGFNERDHNGMLRVPQLLRLVFQHYHTALDASNLVDNLPLSEKDLVQYYDVNAKKNYLHWLAEAGSVAVLEGQDFGAGKTAPASLLYLQLRRSLLLQLHKASVKWFGNRNVPLEYTLKTANFHNIRPEPSLTKWEVMKAKIGTVEPLSENRSKLVADHLLTSGRNEGEAIYLEELKHAIGFLAGLPTARLERCFTEHLDCCTYRLDAWQSALFKLRLKGQRQLPDDNEPQGRNQPNRQERKKGIYIGAYGWLEDIRPSSKRQVVQEEIPGKLRPLNNEPVFEYADNGGFVHAPSINHASAAAVLRSGYLSHANSGQPDLMAVNISSERVRRALFILQGIRNGQTLEALLGYQFERGLHDRASANNALSKLNLYIYNFRDAFAIEQHQVMQQGSNSPAETIPANNVVNGLLLAENKDAFPYGAKNEVTSASTDERAAIEQEKNKLADTLDAVKDLLLSESAYQLVMGNFDRSGAILNALRDANIPPDIDVINTPRSSHFNFTNRVTIQFEKLDAWDDANNPWFPIPMTPRAIMEPGLNSWLGKILGSADSIHFRVAHLDKDNTELGFDVLTLDKLQLQPVDFIYITGNELNTGDTSKDSNENKTGASELEARIASNYRHNHALDNDVRIRIEFLKPGNAATKPLGILLPQLKMLKSLITDSRHINAADFEIASRKTAVDKNNPKGYDVNNLLLRVKFAQTVFQKHLQDLRTIAISATVQDNNGVATICNNLGEAFDALDAAKLDFPDSIFTFSTISAGQLHLVMSNISLYGLAASFPQLTTVLTDNEKLILLQQARSLARRMKAADSNTSDLVTAANDPEAEKNTRKLLEAGKALLGDGFNILPHFTYNNEADILQSRADANQLLNHATDGLKMQFPADEWMLSVSHVRPRLTRWEFIRSLYDLNNVDTLTLSPVQLPYRANDSWVALEFPEKNGNDPSQPFTIDHDTLSVIIHGEGAFNPASKHSGLLVDDWTELIPAKEEITGITFNYNQPNATPPQALLLAVTPEETGAWSWDALVGILNDTLLRAKLRAVEPQLLDGLDNPQLSVLLPALLANFSKYDLDFALDYKLNLEFFSQRTPIVAASLINR